MSMNGFPLRLVAPTAVTLAVLTACGSGQSAASPAATTTSGRGAAVAAFRRCMADHGVTLPQRARPTDSSGGAAPGSEAPHRGAPGGQPGDGGGRFLQPPPGVDPAAYQTALGACRSQLPAGGNGSQFRTAFAAYVTCLRNHGIQAGDPSQGPGALNGVDRTSPAFQAADQQCRPLLPERPGPGSTTTRPAAS